MNSQRVQKMELHHTKSFAVFSDEKLGSMIPVLWITLTFWLSCLSLMSANPIPRTSDRAVGIGNIIQSSRFTDTDEICQWLFGNWMRGLPSEALRTQADKVQPAVVSHKAKVVVEQSIIWFYCSDFRKKSIISAASMAGEARESGPYRLHCNEQTERPDTQKVFLSNWRKDYRLKGVCIPRSNPSSSTSTHVDAGMAACLEVQPNYGLAELEAFMDEDDEQPPPDVHVPDLFTQWLTIRELGTDRQVRVDGKSSVSMRIDPAKPAIYRVCGKQLAGHGNARLRFLAIYSQ